MGVVERECGCGSILSSMCVGVCVEEGVCEGGCVCEMMCVCGDVHVQVLVRGWDGSRPTATGST